MKPTSGPWEIQDDSHDVDGVGRVNLYRVVAPNGDVVAEFSNAGCNEIVFEDDPDYGGDHYDYQAMSNATLIAAAPDLYAVLDALLDSKVAFDSEAHRISAKAALAKARGEVTT